MSFISSTKKLFESIGKNTNPLYAVVTIALTKAIFKPISTFMDKNETKETKVYTAIREVITEVVAIPAYIICQKIAEKGAAAFKKPNKAKRAKSNLGFLGVCVAALVVIPALSNVAIKPLTERIYKKDTSKTQPPEINTKMNSPKNITNFYPLYQHGNSFKTFKNWGMKI